MKEFAWRAGIGKNRRVHWLSAQLQFKNNLMKLPALAFLLVCCVPAHGSEFTLAPVYTDHMVVQRGQPVVVLGTAAAGEQVTAEFAGSMSAAVADAKGVFRLKLPAQKASKQGRVLTVKTPTSTLELKDVLVGDVWLCSGQSNMAFDFRQIDIADEVKNENRPLIRAVRFKETFQPLPVNPMQEVVTSAWQAGTPDAIAGWSPAGYYFARCIQDHFPDLPIGLCVAGYGGSPIECWIPMETWAQFPAFKEGAEVAKRQQNPVPPDPADQGAWRMPSGMFNAMIFHLTEIPLAGVIWYQGESNAGQPDYAIKMQALVGGWRKAWGSDFPFYYVQLAGYMRPSDDPAVRTEWALTRDLQRRALDQIPKSGMASAFDIGDMDNIHPKNKVDVGERLARWALRDVYGDRKIVVSGPLYKEMKIEGGKARIRFDYAEGGLMAGNKDAKTPAQEIKNGKLGGFAVGNKDGKWAWADAVIEGQSVVVSSSTITEPVAVRYGLTNSPGDANLYNKAGLPASPFTTEK